MVTRTKLIKRVIVLIEAKLKVPAVSRFQMALRAKQDISIRFRYGARSN